MCWNPRSGAGIVGAEGFEIADGILRGRHVSEIFGGAEAVTYGHRHRGQLNDALMSTAGRHLGEIHVAGTEKEE